MATLEELLGQIRGAGSDFQAAGNQMRALQEKEDLRQFASDLPAMLQQQDYSQVAGRALAAGVPTITTNILSGQQELLKYQAQQAAKAKEDKPLDPLIIQQAEKTYGIKIPVDKPGSVQKELISQAEKGLSFGLKEQQLGIAKKDESRRSIDATQKARVDFLEKLNSRFGKKLDVIDKLNTLDSFPLDSAAAVQALISNIVKTIGADSGALSVQDIQSYIPKTVAGDLKGLENYLKNQGDTPIPEDVKAGLKRLLQNSRDKSIENNRERAIKDIKAGIESRRDRLIEGDRIEEAVLTEAAKFGLGVKIGKDGEVIVAPFDKLTEKTGNKTKTTLPSGDTEGLSPADFSGVYKQAADAISSSDMSDAEKQENYKKLKAKVK